MNKIFILCFFVASILGCQYLEKKNNVHVYINLSQPNITHSSILIFNFKDPSYALGSGVKVAEVFHQKLLKSKKFKVISLNSYSSWDRIGQTEEERLGNAMTEGRKKEYDYILVGEVLDFFYGGTNKTKVKIKIRIIDPHSEKTIFFADNYKENLGKDPSYPLDTQLTKTSLNPLIVATELIEELIKKI